MRKFYELLGILDNILDLKSQLGEYPQYSFLSKMIRKSTSFGSEIPLKNHVKMLTSLRLLNIQEGRVVITERGEDFYKLKNQPGSILNDAQKIQMAFFLFNNNNSLGSYYRQFLDLFHYNSETNHYICKYTSNNFPYSGRQWLEELLYLNVISDYRDYLVISDPFIHYLCLNQRKQITQEELEKRLERNKEIGEEKEKLALKFEQLRLKKLKKKKELSLRVKLISKDFSNAGFDILSFNGNVIFYDRFIEVKSSADGVTFFITDNEIQTSKLLGEKYWIYVISTSPKSDKYRLKMIKNFYDYSKENIKLTPVNYKAILNSNVKESYFELSDFDFIESNNDLDTFE
jgi:hypothetical protein